MKFNLWIGVATIAFLSTFMSCKPKMQEPQSVAMLRQKPMQLPVKYDEFYNFVSGGFSGQLSAYGLPSGRLLRLFLFFSRPRKGWGYSEETKPMLMTSWLCPQWLTPHPSFFKPAVKSMADGYSEMPTITPRWLCIDLKTFVPPKSLNCLIAV